MESQRHNWTLVKSVWEDQISPGEKGGMQRKRSDGKKFLGLTLLHGSIAGTGGASFPLSTVIDVPKSLPAT